MLHQARFSMVLLLSNQGTPIFIFIFDIISGSLLVWNFINIVSSDRTVERYSSYTKDESISSTKQVEHLFHPFKVQTNPSHLLNRGGGKIKISPAKQATTECAWAGPRLKYHQRNEQPRKVHGLGPD